MLRLNEYNLADNFNDWSDLLKRLLGQNNLPNIDKEVWDLIRIEPYEELGVLENVYQAVLLKHLSNAIKDHLIDKFNEAKIVYPENIFDDEIIQFNTYINAVGTSLNISYRGECLGEISDYDSLKEITEIIIKDLSE